MAKITLDIPDELMEQLSEAGENFSDWLRQRLPDLLGTHIQQPPLPTHVYRYILDFIASNPTPQQILDFRPTLEMQERLQTLLDHSSSGDLRQSEQEELDEYERIEHIVIMLKAGHFKHLVGQA